MPWLAPHRRRAADVLPGPGGRGRHRRRPVRRRDPGGRLTQTFPVDDDHHPVAGDPRRYPGVNGVEEYSEGVHVGYRWYDAEGVRPLFPFGHGLSYTSFAYEDLAWRGPGTVLSVVFTVRNTGGGTGSRSRRSMSGPSPDLQARPGRKGVGRLPAARAEGGASRGGSPCASTSARSPRGTPSGTAGCSAPGGGPCGWGPRRVNCGSAGGRRCEADGTPCGPSDRVGCPACARGRAHAGPGPDRGESGGTGVARPGVARDRAGGQHLRAGGPGHRPGEPGHSAAGRDHPRLRGAAGLPAR